MARIGFRLTQVQSGVAQERRPLELSQPRLGEALPTLVLRCQRLGNDRDGRLQL
jgi:hypothetical protein